MASVSKIAANRRNASRSTGPRSRIGKSHARRNAVRHGLAARAVLGAEEAASVQAMADQIVDGSSGVLTFNSACVVAQAELDLVRIRELKVTLIQNAIMQQRQTLVATGRTAGSMNDQGDLAAAVRQTLPQLLKYDRYERRAAARRDRGISALVEWCLIG